MIDYSRRGTYPYEIVGVVGDMQSAGMKVDPRPEIFMPHAQVPYVTMNVVLRTSTDTAPLIPAVREVILEMDPTQPVRGVMTMAALVASSVAGDRFSTFLLDVLSVLALTLAASGICSVMAYSVRQRSHEIGVRMALGARRGAILRMVIAQGGLLTALAVGIGVSLALVLGQAMSSLLYYVSATDGLTFLVVPTLLALSAFGASLVLAYRAMRVDPIQTLQHE